MCNDLMPLAWLPNKEGFVFIGVKRDGSEAQCVVELGDDGCHRVAGNLYRELIGWKYL